VKINFSSAWESGHRIVNSVIGRLPQLGMAIVVFAIFFFIGATARRLVRKAAARRGRRQSLGILLGHLTHLTIVILGFLISLAIIAPSFQAADLIKILGIGSVAIGFAFQNILQNFLAGILLLISEPFNIGDIISVTGLEGRVEDIQARATIITEANGRTVVIPNAVLFTNAVTVAGPAAKDYGKPEQKEPEPATAQTH
jgi:small conductance mechanosensitive channel